MKKLTILLLSFFLTFSALAPAYADIIGGDEGVRESIRQAIDKDSEEPVADKGGPLERILAAIVEVPCVVVRGIGGAAGFRELDELVFSGNMWVDSEVRFIRYWYLALAGLAIPFFIIVIIVTAFKLVAAGVNPASRAEAVNSIWRWFAALGIVLIAPLFVDVLLHVVGIMLDGIKVAFQAVAGAAGIDRGIDDWSSVGFADVNVVTGSVLGTAFVKLGFTIIYIYFNILYLIRKLAVSVMLCFTPVMAVMWALNRNVNAAGIWLGEIVSNAFMPVAHALVLCMILGFCDVKNVTEGGTWVAVLVFLYTLIPLAEVLRNSMQNLFTRMSGMHEEGVARKLTAAAFGLGGLVSLGRVAGATAGSHAVFGDVGITGMRKTLEPVKTSGRGWTGGGPGGYAPDIFASAGGSVDGSTQIGFRPPGEAETGGTASVNISGSRQSGFHWPGEAGTAGPARSTPGFSVPPKAMQYGMAAANAAGKALGAMTRVTGGVVPSGERLADGLARGIEGGARVLGAAGATFGHAVHQRITGQADSMGEAVRKTTGVKEDGIKGTMKAVGRAGNIAMQSARDVKAGIQQLMAYQSQQFQEENLQKPTIGFRQPGKGLK